ncbi:MAG: hypothetical protein EXX96DRAFT_620770 [Benjaminiella poitrasii]|nr:MAG: hypothetical protein EXX96DRAFT_620770 [Benjaminiella poitrasii]
MLHHPLESADANLIKNQEVRNSEYDSLPPLTDEDLSSFQRRVTSPTKSYTDNIVRAQSPFGRRYLKPINGIQTKGFARSAQRRSSVLTLGSIERLQNFYAKKELKVDKNGTLGFRPEAFVEEPDDMDDVDQLPTPREPPPSWIDLDVETDLDVLLSICFDDIQTTLTTWSIITEPSQKSLSDGSLQTTNGVFQILPLLQSVTTMLSSVKNYTVNRHDLSNEVISKLRHASLDLLEAIKELETEYRLKEEEEDKENAEGFLYGSSNFSSLEKERKAINDYLHVIEKYAFNPPHHIGSPPAVFTPEIQALMGKTEILSLIEEETVKKAKDDSSVSTKAYCVPAWLERGSFVNDSMGRYYALMLDNLNESNSVQKQDIPNPAEDKELFLKYLSDGIVLCNVYNSLVKQSRRPFGLITKIHEDTRRTYRAIENLRFFSAACKFRFELVFDEFDPSEIARKSDKGLSMIDKALNKFCDCVIRELREQVDLAAQKKTTIPKKTSFVKK